MSNMSRNILPAVALHRFDGELRPGLEYRVAKEVDNVVYICSMEGKEGVKGPSFLHLYPETAKEVHEYFGRPCKLTVPNAELAPNFEMRRTRLYRRGGVVVGQHYDLPPLLHEMPLANLKMETERLKATVCQLVCGAGPSSLPQWPPKEEEPSDILMVWVAFALLDLAKSDKVETGSRVIAGLTYSTICSDDMDFGQLLADPSLAEFILYAMGRYKPPVGDPIAESDCESIIEQLSVAVQEQEAGFKVFFGTRYAHHVPVRP